MRRALHHCESTQLDKLNRLVLLNGRTAYGRAHGFHRIHGLQDWRERVPIVGYEDLEPYILRAAKGEADILTAEPVRIFERSSGSTSGNKLIPYTASLLAEFSAATGAWLFNLNKSFPGLAGTKSYWSVSPAQRQAETTSGGLRIGFDDDTEYFSRLERFALKRMLAVGPEASRLRNSAAWVAATIDGLLRAENLGFISVWHPSFFALLLEEIETRWEAWMGAHAPHRLPRIRRSLQGGSLAQALWPRLQVVSCWGDGPARKAMRTLAQRLPGVFLQPKGLLATEGAVSFPLQHGGRTLHVAAILSHFYEFLDPAHPNRHPLLAHQLKPGAEYVPLISTGGGFYRYRLGDIVRCAGYHDSTPLLSFQGRMDQVTDLCGEKLNAHQASAALDGCERDLDLKPVFALIAPAADGPPRYTLYVEGVPAPQSQKLADHLERKFCESHGYAYARKLGQLLPMQARIVAHGAEKYLRAKEAEGKRIGQIKPCVLEKPGAWDEVFLAHEHAPPRSTASP